MLTTTALVLDVIVTAMLVHTLVNARLLRRPPTATWLDERVSILLPMRNEAGRLGACLPAVMGQQLLRHQETIVYDDGSTDGTAREARRVGGDLVNVIDGEPLPAGWLGKPHACARLAELATGSVLVFVDADVVLAPDAVARAVALLREQRLAFVSPYPRQLAGSWSERLVQPLLQWSWLAFLPLRLAERSPRPSLAAANGQLLVVDADTYRAAGGHAAIRDEVLDDVALARLLRRSGGRGGFAAGHDLATCRMYDGPRALIDGYTKSLWSAFGPRAGALAVVALVLLLGVVPWVLLAFTLLALPAAVGGPASRLVAALRCHNRPLVDAVAHPISTLAFAALVVLSLARHRRGRLTWKGRSLP